MSGPSDTYVNEMRDRFSYFATWLPNSPLRLGDVGLVEFGYFKQQTSLEELNIEISKRISDQTIDFVHTSRSGLSMESKTSARAKAGTDLPLANASIHIGFTDAGAFLFHAMSCSEYSIDNLAKLGERILQLIKEGKWRSEWRVIMSLLHAESATILVANSAGSKIELIAKTGRAVSNLADTQAGLSMKSQSGDVTQFICQKGLTPLYRPAQVKQSVLDRVLGRRSPIMFKGPTEDLSDSIFQVL